MYRDYSKNALAVREKREEDVYLYLKGGGLEARFWCDFHRDFYQTVIRNPKLLVKNSLLCRSSQSTSPGEIQTTGDHQVRCKARSSIVAQMLCPLHRKRWWQ
jgi:hypothetical protein